VTKSVKVWLKKDKIAPSQFHGTAAEDAKLRCSGLDISHFKSARSIMNTKMEPGEKVDDYVSKMQHLAKSIKADEKMIVTFNNTVIPIDDSSSTDKRSIKEIFRSIRDICFIVQEHVKWIVKHMHNVLLDLPTGKQRERRGIFTNFLSSVTGLASKDQLNSLKQILERVETGIHTSAEMWGRGTKNLVASFKVVQDTLDNVHNVLRYYRKTIFSLQTDLLNHRRADATGFKTIGEIMRWMAKSSREMAEGDRLLTAVQMLVTGEIPNLLVPHCEMIKALNHVDRYLERSADHLTLVHHDFGFYYSDISMQMYVVTGHSHGHFDPPNYLLIVLDAPATTRTLIQPFNIYELIKFPLPMPEEDRFYSLLATDIRYIGFNRDRDLIMTLDWGHNLPEPDIWLQHDLAVKFWNWANPSCAVALADGNLAEIKHWCRYGIHKNPMPSSVIHLHRNKWLLTNISVLQVHCPDADGLLRAPTHTQYLTELQTVMTFGCHCDYIRADNFRIITDEDYCEVQEDISATVEIKHRGELAPLIRRHP